MAYGFFALWYGAGIKNALAYIYEYLFVLYGNSSSLWHCLPKRLQPATALMQFAARNLITRSITLS